MKLRFVCVKWGNVAQWCLYGEALINPMEKLRWKLNVHSFMQWRKSK